MCKIISLPLPASKTSSKRSVTFLADPTGTAGTMTVCQGKQVTTYRLTEHVGVPYPCRGFHVEKLAGGTDPEATGYDVLIDAAAGHTCECRGFLRHGHCSHVDAIRQLLADGSLDVAAEEPSTDPFPTPEQVAADAAFDVPPYARRPCPDLPGCFAGLGASSIVAGPF